MNYKAKTIILRAFLAALMLSAVFAGSAAAAPVWKFNGTELTKGTETETILGGAEKSGLTVPGMTTTCDNFLYQITISNSKAGTGEGSLTELPLYECYTDGVCTVKTITPHGLPWASHLSTVSSKNYITIENVDVEIIYAGEECVLEGFAVEVTGKAGGLLDNSTESATFGPTSFKATGTKLEALGEEIEWNGVFPTEAFKWHREQALSVS